MKKIRIFYKPNGSIITMYPVMKCLKENESITEFLDKETIKAGFKDLPYDDFSPEELPDKNMREKWKGEKGKGVWVDHSIVTVGERIKSKQDELDKELEKESPDAVKLIRINRELEKMKNA